MQQILQSLKTGLTLVSEVPCPQIKQGHLLIKSWASLISAGTERMLIDFGKANYLQKAKSQPEKVKQVLDKIRTDGLVPTVQAVRSKLDQPLPLGYCSAGVVQEIGKQEHKVADFNVGDRVVSNGPHAEMVCVPKNLCARIPYGIEDEAAAFTVIAAVGLQGVRLAQPMNQLIYLFNQSIDDATDQPIIMVGFNRRFAPHIVRIKKMLDTVREPKSFITTVNAGFIPADHWTQDPEIGGGRIIGEACHFIDLLRFLVGYKIVTADLVKMRTDLRDTVSISMTFEDGSIGSVHYFANGNKSFPKERLEVFCAGRILQLDNFRSMTGYGWPGFKKMKLLKQDKGHGAGVAAFINAVQAGGSNPIPFSEIVEVTKVSLELAEAAH